MHGRRRQTITAIIAVGVTLVIMTAANAENVRPQCPPTDSSDYYFPIGTFGPPDEKYSIDEFMRDWFSDHLRAAAEPSLSCGPADATEVLRFEYLPSFAHPVMVRITKSHDDIAFSAVELDGAGGYEPGKVSHRAAGKVTPETWRTIQSMLSTLDFWNLSATETETESGEDGDEWVFEARRDGAHHVIERWTPTAGPIYDLGKQIYGVIPTSSSFDRLPGPRPE